MQLTKYLDYVIEWLLVHVCVINEPRCFQLVTEVQVRKSFRWHS